MESRIVRLETIVEATDKRLGLIESDVRSIRDKVDTNFHITWVGIIVAALGLAGLMARGFHWL